MEEKLIRTTSLELFNVKYHMRKIVALLAVDIAPLTARAVPLHAGKQRGFKTPFTHNVIAHILSTACADCLHTHTHTDLLGKCTKGVYRMYEYVRAASCVCLRAWICPPWRDALGPQKNNGSERHLQFPKQLWGDLQQPQRATWPGLILLAQRVSERHHFSLMKLVTLWKVTRLPLHWFMHWCSEADYSRVRPGGCGHISLSPSFLSLCFLAFYIYAILSSSLILKQNLVSCLKLSCLKLNILFCT